MALQPVYLVSARNLSKFLEGVRHAQAPEKFSLRFLEDLGFKSTNDRLFIPLLKAMRFLDDGGKPTERYHAFLDDTQWKSVLADGIREAFPDLFRVNRNAQQLPREQLAGKIKSLGEGKISPAVLANTTKTFLELVKLAEFGQAEVAAPSPDDKAPSDSVARTDGVSERRVDDPLTGDSLRLVYRIEIVLPAVRDQAIYDAIFRSAREHLLK